MLKFIFLLTFAFTTFCNTSLFSQEIIKAKVAILHKSGDDFTVLHSNDRLRVGEMIRIFVQPENDCYVYIIHSDNAGSTLLHNAKVYSEADTLILPSTSEFYVFDDKSSNAEITILCTLEKNDEIEGLFNDDAEAAQVVWNKLEKKILDKYKKKLDDKSEKPFPMAGNVSAVNDEFLSHQLVLSGKGALIRKYEIEIKK